MTPRWPRAATPATPGWGAGRSRRMPSASSTSTWSMTRWPPSNILETWWWCRCPGVCRPLVLALRPPPVRAGEGHHEALPGQSLCKYMGTFIDKTGENVYCLYLQAYHWHISYIKGLTLTLWELCNPHSKHVIHFYIDTGCWLYYYNVLLSNWLYFYKKEISKSLNTNKFI